MKAYDDGQARFYAGDVRAVLKELPANSVHCVVTSPPYWGLRDYGTPGQLGLEATPEEYVATMVDVFREVRRVLRDDATCWINIGDSYAANGNGGGSVFDNGRTDGRVSYEADRARGRETNLARVPAGLKAKDLVGIPWMLAFALRADGWWLRQDIIWSKPNPMPESVTDRCTKAHEYVFLLSKSARYYYDADAVREEHQDKLGIDRFKTSGGNHPDYDPSNTQGWVDGGGIKLRPGPREYNPAGRNKRSVWTIATEAYSEAHFATFPQALVKPCILAGTSEHGVCSECGAPWARVTERTLGGEAKIQVGVRPAADVRGVSPSSALRTNGRTTWDTVTAGWKPTCRHFGDTDDLGLGLADVLRARDDCQNVAKVVPATVLDPFLGSGTTAMVAKALGRHAIGIDLNPTYLAMAAKRCAQMGLM